MDERMNKTRIKILTNSGYKYVGILVEKNSSFVVLIDDKEGKIEIPLNNISFLKEVEDDLG